MCSRAVAGAYQLGGARVPGTGDKPFKSGE